MGWDEMRGEERRGEERRGEERRGDRIRRAERACSGIRDVRPSELQHDAMNGSKPSVHGNIPLLALGSACSAWPSRMGS
jgi:hypothetical protein